MSCCLIMQDKHNIIIGADTASSVKRNNTYVRYSNNAKKIFIYQNDVVFCSGEMNSVNDVIKHIDFINDYINVEAISEYLKNNYNYQNEYIDIEMIICRVKSNISYMYQLSKYNNYDVKINMVNHDGTEIYSVGINTKKI